MRRAFLLAGTLIGVSAAPPGAARTVQLIPMGTASSEQVPADHSGVDGDVVHQFFGRPVDVAHGPDRRSIEVQLMDNFLEHREMGDQPLSSEPDSHSSRAPAMVIPSWMTGGPFVASAPRRWVPGCLPIGYRPAGFLTADAEGRRQGYYGLMSQVACEYGIPVGLFDAMIIQESRYRHHVFSSKNAYGLTQLMPGTAAELGVDRYAVDQNLRGGARYLRQQLDRFGQVHLALAAYNAGPGRVRGNMLPPIRETRHYVDAILGNWSRLSGLAVPARRLEAPQAPGDRQGAVAYRMAQVSTF